MEQVKRRYPPATQFVVDWGCFSALYCVMLPVIVLLLCLSSGSELWLRPYLLVADNLPFAIPDGSVVPSRIGRGFVSIALVAAIVALPSAIVFGRVRYRARQQ